MSEISDDRVVFQQILELIENDVIAGIYRVDEVIISTAQMAKVYSVSHGTVGKAINTLVKADILYKKRGIGMCVADSAREKIIVKRKDVFFNKSIGNLLAEAKRLDITLDELI